MRLPNLALDVLEPEEVARRVTDGLVEKFDCAFARLWLVEADQPFLKLVASSGMYTRTNGFFARVPMGAYKVGKIAQNRISFLSNNLAAEPWVGNREWAIAHNIRGFAGYPLAVKERVVGVLATFSHQPLEPEFLEVLQTLCTIVTIALDVAIQHQKEKQNWQVSIQRPDSLSEQLASILKSARLTLVGTEQALTLPVAYVFLDAATTLNRLNSASCRLIYSEDSVALEAIIPTVSSANPPDRVEASLNSLLFTSSCLGGELQTQASLDHRSLQMVLRLPYTLEPDGLPLRVQCRLPLVQRGLTHQAFLAGFTVCTEADAEVLLLTDDVTQIRSAKRVVWVQQGSQPLPQGIKARVDLSVSPSQLRSAIAAVLRGKTWDIDPAAETQQIFSERELEILVLLTQGHRDRDIADRLIISESTVKFHMNNVLTKLKVRTRYQAIHQAIVQGWI